MRETPEELAELQRLMDATMAHVNPHMASIVTPESRLSAAQVVRHLEGKRFVAFATVTLRGEPRVSPLDAFFIHGRWTMSTGGTATRVTNLRVNPACSVAYLEGDSVGVVANGTVEWLDRDHPAHDEIHAIWLAAYHSDPYSWGDDVVFFRVVPTSMWAYAPHPGDFPS